MSTRPILFSTLMVTGILKGHKTQTRRCSGLDGINISPGRWRLSDMGMERCSNGSWCKTADFAAIDRRGEYCPTGSHISIRCPYGTVGDNFWVRETFARKDGGFIYLADNGNDTVDQRWYPAIHMPRTACRLRLEIVSLKAERLHDINKDDALAEGATWALDISNPHKAFEIIWRRINGADSWHLNPWIWAIGFKIV